MPQLPGTRYAKAIFPFIGAPAIGGAMASSIRLQQERRQPQAAAAAAGFHRDADSSQRAGPHGFDPAGCGSARWVPFWPNHSGPGSEPSIRVTGTDQGSRATAIPHDLMASPRALRPRFHRTDAPPTEQQPEAATPFMSPQGGQSAQSDDGVMYAEEAMGAYATNYDPSTMNLTIDEFLVQRQRQHEVRALRDSDASRRRTKLPMAGTRDWWTWALASI